jgi:hypothetical protein
MAVATRGTANNYLQRAPSPSGLADVIDAMPGVDGAADVVEGPAGQGAAQA